MHHKPQLTGFLAFFGLSLCPQWRSLCTLWGLSLLNVTIEFKFNLNLTQRIGLELLTLIMCC